MNPGWSIVVVAVAAVVAFFLFHVAKGTRQQRRESARQDFIQLQGIRKVAASLAEVSNQRAVAFAPPFAQGRSQPLGWLWWAIDVEGDDKTRQSEGWTWTYRGARKAAGVPLAWRREEVEVTIAVAEPAPRRVPNS